MPYAEGTNILHRNRFADAVRGLRAKRGLDQAGLADAAEISRSTLSFIERGRSLPSLEVAARLAVALGCSLDRLIEMARR